MSYATFPSSWTPPTSCFVSSDIYIVITSIGTTDTGVVQAYDQYWYGVGFTAPSGNCIPPSYTTSSPYYAQSCPPAYREALASPTTISDQVASATLCCPGSLYSFGASGTEGCESVFGDQTFVATWTNLVNSNDPQRPTTVSSHAGFTLSAFGITVISTTPASTTPTSISQATTNSNTQTATSSPSATTAVETNSPTSSPEPTILTSGATAGIAVGATVATFALLLLVWILYRRRLKTSNQSMTRSDSAQRIAENGLGHPSGKATPVALTQRTMYPSPYDAHQTQQQRYELGSSAHCGSISELPSS
ncbi:hypothetical protein F5Y16DRAFT_380892 [Xylariaceae sp. FL0255]|nr:hypothetical protein F5Y16DRAFT_380892 [Xylariaceae sp. FL0255]